MQKKAYRPLIRVHFRNVMIDLAFFPQELHCVNDPQKQFKTKIAKKKLDMSLLDRLEQQDSKGKNVNVVEEDDELVILPEQYEEEAEEEDNDYLIQYDDDDYDAAGMDSDGN